MQRKQCETSVGNRQSNRRMRLSLLIYYFLPLRIRRVLHACIVGFTSSASDQSEIGDPTSKSPAVRAEGEDDGDSGTKGVCR